MVSTLLAQIHTEGKIMKKKNLPKVGVAIADQKIELSENQQNPGGARPENFEITHEGPEYEGGGQTGDSASEHARLMKIPRRAPYVPTPERNNVNFAEPPKTGSELKK